MLDKHLNRHCFAFMVPDEIMQFTLFFPKGCKEGLMDWFAEHATILGGIGIGIACLEVYLIDHTIPKKK